MTVLILDNATQSIRGELCKWMIEVKPGVFLSSVSALVRAELWKKVITEQRIGGAILSYNAPTEIGFTMEMHGEPTRSIIDMEGLQLIKRQEI